MSVTLRSLAYFDSYGNPIIVTVPRDNIVTLFPTSLLASALQLDPEAEVIDIPNADVTPKALIALEYILTYQDLPNVPVDPEYNTAGNYLNIDALSLLSDPTLPLFRQEYPDINLIDFNPESYRTVVEFAIWNNSPMLSRYIFGHVPPEQTKAIDEYMVRGAAESDNLAVLDQLLRRGVDPSANNNDAIHMAAYHGRTDAVKRLLADPRVDPGSSDNWALYVASTNDHLDIVNLLLADPRVDPSANSNAAIREASAWGRLDIVNRLLEDPRVDPSDDNNVALIKAIRRNRQAVVDRLLQDERVRTTYQP